MTAPSFSRHCQIPPTEAKSSVVENLIYVVWPIYSSQNPFPIDTVFLIWASLVAQMVKNLPAMQETRVQPLGQEDPLEKEMATHSSILAWEIP